jgi:HSP20 family protein
MSDQTSHLTRGRADVSTSENTRAGRFFTPPVDICETSTELILFADLPGVRVEDLDLQYEKGELRLLGRVPPRHGRNPFLLNEYSTGDYYRVFTIHESIDAARISADCKNGVLVVHLPKMEAHKPRQITVRGG